MSVDPNIETEADLWRWYTQTYLTQIVTPPNGLSLIIEKLQESDIGNIINNIIKIFMPKKMNIGESSSNTKSETEESSSNTESETEESSSNTKSETEESSSNTKSETEESSSNTASETTASETTASETTASETTASETTESSSNPTQAGGGLFCQKDYKIDGYCTFRLEAYRELITYLNNNNIKISLLTKQLLKKLYLYHYSIGYVKALNYILFKIKEHTLPVKLRNSISNMFERIRNELYNKLIT
jgi:DNA mismatch repair ATPase MutL